ncbi:MAG: hypothetical protein KAT15_06105, partial [Bacteroidales bacterium]|nr:hypothetical protein [Bacteroidales bacterium]
MVPYINKLVRASLLIIPIILVSCAKPDIISIIYNKDSEVLTYGAERLAVQFRSSGLKVREGLPGKSVPNQIVILFDEDRPDAEIAAEGFRISRKGDSIIINGNTTRGCLYGIMDLLEQIGPACEFDRIIYKQVNPALSFRAIKFNLPWSPYRPGPATEVHLETCRDLDFWESFLDMMVENRFNALTLWNTHPFPYMIRASNYPEATPFNDLELAGWQSFWKTLFKMAKSRGIETYLVNWNIVVSPQFASAYGAEEYSDQSELVKKYTRESVTQVINEYEDLTGLGVTLADWMGNWGDRRMTSAQREDWIEETFVMGMAEAGRKVKFIHRAVLAGDPMEMRRVIDRAGLPDQTLVEVKFNWSHGHFTPHLSLTHSNDDGTIMKDFWDPLPENYFIAWMVRNEDFFVLRWGDPGFIREHIETNLHEYVDGYFIGSEGYIPAKDYSHVEPHPHKTWKYAFEKQWLFYHLWGRLIYQPGEKDETLALGFNRRYENVEAAALLEACALASKVPLSIASFYKSTWDFTLYSEGFLSAWPTGFDDRKSPFISIEELINHETLDKRYLGIREFCSVKNRGHPVNDQLTDPLELAEKVEAWCLRAIAIVNNLRLPDPEPALDSELDDIETWCHLGFYFADKLRAGVSVET